MTDPITTEKRDGEYAICPYCGEKHGDCWEWLPSEDIVETECSECGKKFIAWASITVTYVTRSIEG